MALSLQLLPEQKLIMGLGEGEVTPRDLLDYLRRLHGLEAEVFSYDEIVDLRNADVSGLHLDGLLDVADRCRNEGRFSPSAKLAIVAASDLQYGLSRVYQAHRAGDGRQISVFRDLHAAEAWVSEKPDPCSGAVT